LTEIRRIRVLGQPGKKVYETPSQWKKAGVLCWCTWYPSHWRKHKQENHSPGQLEQDPISKITRTKRVRGMIQVIECLPSKHEVLSSNARTNKK
jgi:hypothetical protein